jgi:hypothetical protein
MMLRSAAVVPPTVLFVPPTLTPKLLKPSMGFVPAASVPT